MKKYAFQPLAFKEYDPTYLNLYREEKDKIQNKLGKYISRIDHIGSTAVPGLPGKPIIDILLVIKSEDDAKSCLSSLEELDYEYVDKPDQYYLRKSTGETTGFHLHMVTPENKFWRERIAFRDYLINHPDVKDEYMNLKQSLIKQFGDDKRAYREGKERFMAETSQRALEEYPNL